MKLSTRSRYGLRLMFELALQYNMGQVNLKEISLHQKISEKYLSKLVIPLRGANLILSARGMKGGYALSRSPAQITIREILEPLEGGLTPVDCVGNKAGCSMHSYCPTRSIWCKLDAAISRVLTEHTLQDLVDEYKQTGRSALPSFRI